MLTRPTAFQGRRSKSGDQPSLASVGQSAGRPSRGSATSSRGITRVLDYAEEMLKSMRWSCGTGGSEWFCGLGGATEGAGYVHSVVARKKTRRPQRPSRRRRPCNVGLTRHGAFWLSCGRLRLGGLEGGGASKEGQPVGLLKCLGGRRFVESPCWRRRHAMPNWSAIRRYKSFTHTLHAVSEAQGLASSPTNRTRQSISHACQSLVSGDASWMSSHHHQHLVGGLKVSRGALGSTTTHRAC